MQLFTSTNSSAVGPSGANRLTDIVGGSSDNSKGNLLDGMNWGELYSQGNAGHWPQLSAPGPVSGHGWTFDGSTLTNKMYERSNQWFDQLQLYVSSSGVVLDILQRIWQYDSFNVKYTEYAEITYTNLALSSGLNSLSQSNVLLPEMRFPGSNTWFYADCWANVHTYGGTLAVVQNAFSTYMQGPDPVAVYNAVKYVDILGEYHVPTFKHQPKPHPRVERRPKDDGVPIVAEKAVRELRGTAFRYGDI